ncbi:hypothetical protein OnM2_101001 [Erysiphe neolycopersici]|uniref:RhoGAP-domain-containing protein n=1 Tax=Erysiphe neolycopersici TaxID=212602 RepID=A0A420H910_9PEZI|nr:hypothetical protein OnM2_101001 [Erysiphe neolycopersici]
MLGSQQYRSFVSDSIMSRVPQSDENRSQSLFWPSLESNIENIPALLEKAPQHKLSFNTLKTNIFKFTPALSNSASSSPISPRSFASLNYKDTCSSKEHLVTNSNPEKNLRVPEESFGIKVGEDNHRDSKSYDFQIKPFTRSISEPTLSINTKNLEFKNSGAETSNSLDDSAQMARTAPRSFSNESVLSYFTEKNLSKTPQDVRFSTEIKNLVSTVGSAEVVIAYLLKEKKSQAAQNSQLWRLVDKQRAMILGLNKDLERALRDKERYRRKVREFVAKASTTESSNSIARLNSQDEIETEIAENSYHGTLEDLNSMDMKIADENNPKSPISLVLAPFPITPKSENFSFQNPANISQPHVEIQCPLEEDDHATSQSLQVNPSSFSMGALIESLHENKEIKRVSFEQRKSPPASLELGNASNSMFRFRSVPDISTLNNYEYDQTSYNNDTDDGYREKLGTSGENKTRANSAFGSGEIRSSWIVKNTDTESPLASAHETYSPTGTTRSINSPDSDVIGFSVSKKSPKLLPTPVRTSSLFTAFRGTIGLPSSPRHHITPVSTKSTLHTKNPINSPPASPTIEIPEASNFPLLSPTTLMQPSLPLPWTPVSTKSMEDIKQETSNPKSPTKVTSIQESQDKASLYDEKLENKSNCETSNDNIFKGFLTDEYPGLLLPPSALDKVNVKVASSRMKPSRASIMFPKNTEEDPVFTLALLAKSDQRELWRVEKDYLSLTLLDQTLKDCSSYNAKFPERSLFSGHAPAKIDARREALNNYLESILKIQNDIHAALEICKYLSLNALEALSENFMPTNMPEKAYASLSGKGSTGKPLKNGYLTKRGKNFGGWKARYFVLDGPVFHYFESPGGPCLGSIRLQSAQIGKQSQPNEKSTPHVEGDDSDCKYRHAFLILEPRRKESSGVIRHVLCAESDLERDQWVDALCQYINNKDQNEIKSSLEQHTHGSAGSNNHNSKIQSHKIQVAQGSKETVFRGISYEDTKPKNKPTIGPRNESPEDTSPIEITNDRESLDNLSQPQSPNGVSKQSSLSQGQNGLSGKQSNTISSQNEKILNEKIKHRKRSFFGFGTKTKIPIESPDVGGANISNNQSSNEQNNLAKNIFGASLSDAVKYSRPVDVSIQVPAVVYRCVEYLDAKNAFHEEGIFRLSGSNLVIKRLRERFNSEGDINLLMDDQYHDIHAVASLLKLYLRELPSTILTRKLHVDFLAVVDLPDFNERIVALNSLVGQLPIENQTLLKYLASFLTKIIDNSDVNKMTIRNVGIVFSPTLNIPATIFSLFLQQYSKIFGVEPDYRSTSTSDSSSINSSNELNNSQASSIAKVRETTRVASKLAGPNFIKSIGASKSYWQNTPENATRKIKRRDSSLFGMNVPGLSQSRGSFGK